MKEPAVLETGSIFHYTSASGLLGILEQRELWVSDIEFLNDAKELRFAVELVRDSISARVDALKYEGDSKDDSVLRQIGFAERLLAALDERFPSTGGSRSVLEQLPYVASFCTDGDVLGMWRGYTGGQGYAIEFDAHRLLDSIGADPGQHDLMPEELNALRDQNSGLASRLSPIGYGEEAVETTLNFVLKKINSSMPLAALVEQTIHRILPDLARYKHDAFAEEKEVRLIVFRNGDLSPTPRLRAANGHLVPYFPIAFPYSAVRSIRVGPSPHRERSRMALERWLPGSARGEYSHVQVSVSDAPLLY